ncbi:MAG TPA: RNA polymerase sigma factor [Thermoanaerobaculia bacterium]|jgi:RNA polymerase sigma factor (sigma-70 family)|nr:RNA polymerase sigma factor [Thermoanaerobaculia bacterium]
MGTSRDERHDVYMQYYERVVRYLVRKHDFTVEEARDLAQDVFLSVFRHMEQKPIVAMWLFLKTTAHNRAVNEVRSRIIRRRTDSGSADVLPNLDERLLHDFWTDEPPLSPEAEVSRKEEWTRVRDAIEKLPETYRRCVLLRLEGLSYDEIGVAMRISTHAVRTRLRDAKKLLRKWLSGGDDGED